MSPNWFLGNWTLHPPSKVGLNFSRAFYISLSVIQFMLVATSWSAFLCAFILTWVVILFYFILPHTGIKLHMSMTACKWMLHIYILYGKKELSFFPKSELNDLGMQCRYNSESHPYHNTSSCVIGLISFFCLRTVSGICREGRGPIGLLMFCCWNYTHFIQFCCEQISWLLQQGLLLPNSQVTKRKQSNCLHACTQTIWRHLHTSHSTSTHPIILTTVNPTQAPPPQQQQQQCSNATLHRNRLVKK
jgi:hypothetical protein